MNTAANSGSDQEDLLFGVQRTDGFDWPECGDLRITYTRGIPVPPGGTLAAGILSIEMAKSIARDGTCQLPQRVQTITRQGVTVAMLDAGEGLDQGKTGIWLVDSWVLSVQQRRYSSRVLSPDIRPPGRYRVIS